MRWRSTVLALLLGVLGVLGGLGGVVVRECHAMGPPSSGPLALPGQLTYVQLVHRHGDRTVIHPMPSAAHLWADLPPGVLTERGFVQTRALGQLLATRYIGSGGERQLFDNRTFAPGSVYARSTDVARCIQSAEALIDGLYGVGAATSTSTPTASSSNSLSDSHRRSPFSASPRPSIHVVPTPIDMLLQSPDKCASFALSFAAYAPMADAIAVRDRDLFDLVQRESGWHVGVNTTQAPSYLLYNVLDNLLCEAAHGLQSRSSAALHKAYPRIAKVVQELMMPLYSPSGPSFSLSAITEPPIARNPSSTEPSSSPTTNAAPAPLPLPYPRDPKTDLDRRGTVGSTLLVDFVRNVVDRVLAVTYAERSDKSAFSPTLLARMQLANQRGLDKERLRLYSAHDTTLLALFSSLSVLTKDEKHRAYMLPSYASSVILELRRVNDQPLEWYVSLSFAHPTQSTTNSDLDDNVIMFHDVDDEGAGSSGDSSSMDAHSSADGNGEGGENENKASAPVRTHRPWLLHEEQLLFWCADGLLRRQALGHWSQYERLPEPNGWSKRGVHGVFTCSLAGLAAFAMMLNRPRVWGDALNDIPLFGAESPLLENTWDSVDEAAMDRARIELLEWLAAVPLDVPNVSPALTSPSSDAPFWPNAPLATYPKDDGCCVRSTTYEQDCPSTQPYTALADHCQTFRRMCPWTACASGYVLHSGSLNCVRTAAADEEEEVDDPSAAAGENAAGTDFALSSAKGGSSSSSSSTFATLPIVWTIALLGLVLGAAFVLVRALGFSFTNGGSRDSGDSGRSRWWCCGKRQGYAKVGHNEQASIDMGQHDSLSSLAHESAGVAST